MSSEPEPETELSEVRRRVEPQPPAPPTPREPLFPDASSPRARTLSWILLASVALPVLAFAGYQLWAAPNDDEQAWTPPAGLTAEDTPHWLQTLCADRTPELCAAAERARQATDCDAMRAALRALEDVDRKLSARGAVTAKQHWVLVELYGQGHELCQFERASSPKRKTQP